MRCLTLAKQLRQNQAEVVFISRAHNGNIISEIELNGFQVFRLESSTPTTPIPIPVPVPEKFYAQWLGVSTKHDAEQTSDAMQRFGSVDWLIVDHYALDIDWEVNMRSHAKNVMVIDDLANRSHDCNILLDQNLYPNSRSLYSYLVPSDCELLLGPQYALLRDEFRKAKKRIRPRSGDINKILIFFGGTDPHNLTSRALHALKQVNRHDLRVDVVVGETNPHRNEIQVITELIPGCRYHCQIKNMAEKMVNADLSICAGGTTTWERAYLGLPALTVIMAENQRQMTESVAATGACINLGWHESVTSRSIAEAINDALVSREKLARMSICALSLFEENDKTGAEAVASLIMEKSCV